MNGEFKFSVGKTYLCSGKGTYIAGTPVTIIDRYRQNNYNYYVSAPHLIHREQDLVENSIENPIENSIEKVWHIEYDNSTGPNDSNFEQWWNVTNGTKRFRCDTQEDANWLIQVIRSNQ